MDEESTWAPSTKSNSYDTDVDSQHKKLMHSKLNEVKDEVFGFDKV
jgi:hypothetical protein